MKIQLHIENLVLDDPSARPEALGAALQEELSRLLAERGLPRALARGARLPALSAELKVASRRGAGSGLGRGVAKATFAALRGADPSSASERPRSTAQGGPRER